MPLTSLGRLSLTMGLACALAFAVVGNVRAAYPEKSIEWIVMWSAGGGADTATRIFTKYLEEELGQEIVVKNVTGAGGTIGYLTAKRARADGYTLVSALSDLPKYKPQGTEGIEVNDFDILGGFAIEAPVIVARADAPWSSIEEFVDDAEKNPGKYSIGVSNIGGVHHQPVALWMDEAGFEAKVVSHPGSPQMNAALLGGHVDLISSWVKQSLSSVQDGKLKYLGFFGPDSPPGLDDVPTFEDEGYDVVWPHSYGMGAPKGIPEEAKETLTAAMRKVWANPDFKAELNKLGLRIHRKGPEEYRQELLDTQQIMGDVVKLLND